jgi:arylsulfatase A-like enzyme
MKAAPVFILCCLVSSGFAAQRPQLSQPQNRTAAPDVYLVTIDTLRADHIHCYGYESIQTPALDALAKAGIRFAHAFTPSPITNTSHISILTGLLPSSHGVTDFAVPLAPTHSTLAELFSPLTCKPSRAGGV